MIGSENGSLSAQRSPEKFFVRRRRAKAERDQKTKLEEEQQNTGRQWHHLLGASTWILRSHQTHRMHLQALRWTGKNTSAAVGVNSVVAMFGCRDVVARCMRYVEFYASRVG